MVAKLTLLLLPRNIDNMYQEFVSTMINGKPSIVAGELKQWAPPASDWIKLNVDAQSLMSVSTLAVIPKDENGEVIKV